MKHIMSWNHDKKPDGWGPKKSPDSPPDIEDLLKKWFGFLGGKKPSDSNSSASGDGSGVSVFKMIGLLVVVVAVIWAASGFYIVSPAERGVVLHFGKYKETVGPGPHWIPRGIESKKVVNVDQVMTTNLSTLMLTQKENIVSVAFAVQYRIGNLKDYLFNVVNPVNSLNQVIDSSVRQVIGRSQLDQILTTGRAKIAEQVRVQIEKLLKKYQVGLVVTDVAMQPAKAPEAVKDAFDDVIKAREDQVRLANIATGYANKVVPVSQGQATRILQEAKAYQQQVILKAKGAVSQYLAILPVYDRSPQVTKSRMYLSAMQNVLSDSHVVLSSSGRNMFYLPMSGALRDLSSAPVKLTASTTTTPTVSSSDDTSTDSAASMAAYTRWKEASQ